MPLTTWREQIEEFFNWNELIRCTRTDEEMEVEFDAEVNVIKGIEFTAWTKYYVIFPLSCGGVGSIGMVPRSPCKKSSQHQGTTEL